MGRIHKFNESTDSNSLYVAVVRNWDNSIKACNYVSNKTFKSIDEVKDTLNKQLNHRWDRRPDLFVVHIDIFIREFNHGDGFDLINSSDNLLSKYNISYVWISK